MSFTLTRLAFDALVSTTDLLGDTHLCANYVGRGMYFADTCLALVCDDVSGLVRWTFLLMEMVQDADEDVAEAVAGMVDAMRDYRTGADQMGRQMVYYWPQIGVGSDVPADVDASVEDIQTLLQPNGNV